MSDLDAIRDRIDIVELIGETVQLRKAGRTFKGLCPFHSERTPSFVVSPERRSWHCFGSCSAGGDVFSFLMRRDQLDFGEALRALAARAGVPLAGGPREHERAPRLIQANEAAAGFFHNALLNSSEAARAREYAERRGLDAETIRAFELGYAPDAWDALGAYLRERDFTPEELTEAGLLVEGERGRHDRFRARLIFPIRDERGRVLGFGGRALGDGLPKYLNSPQSPIFDKGSLLYALERARDAIRREDRAVIVEGYLDAIAAHQHGYQNVVATLGTALTDRHIALVKRFARHVALALDADAAGVDAALRGEQLIRELEPGERVEVVVDWSNLVRVQARAPVEVRIFSVPSGKDPDEAIRAEPAAWPAWVEAALPPFEFRLRHELAAIDRANPRERVQLLDRMLPLLTEIGDRAVQAQYLSQLAGAAGVREDDVRLRLNQTLPSSRRGQGVPAREQARRPALTGTAAGDGLRTENFCLALLLRFPELRSTGLRLSADAFVHTPNRLIFERWREDEAIEETELREELREQWVELQSLRIMAGVAGSPAAALDDALHRLTLRRLGEEKRLHTATILEQPAEAVRLVVDEIRSDIETGRRLHLLEYELRTKREAPFAVLAEQSEPAPDMIEDSRPSDAAPVLDAAPEPP